MNNLDFQQYEPYMYKFCYKYNIKDMEDFMQNLRIATIRGLKLFNKKANTNILTYLHRIYLNELNVHIKNNRLIRVPLSKKGNKTLFYSEISPQYYDINISTRNNSFMCNLKTAKRKLKPLEFRIVDLYIKGYSYREIGKYLKLSHETVRIRMKKITHKLKGEWIEL